MKISDVKIENPVILIIKFIKSIIASFLVIKSQQINFEIGIIIFALGIVLMMTDFKLKIV